MDVLTLRGRVWGGSRGATSPGRVLVASDGVIVAVAREADGDVGTVAAAEPGRVISGAWVGPALLDAHVHLSFGPPDVLLRSGVGAVRDLGAPLAKAMTWRRPAEGSEGLPVVTVAGELLTAPGGYPMNGWGADGFGWPVTGEDAAGAAVRRLVEAGVDVVKLALEPADGQPVPDLATCRAVVEAAHGAGLAVTCHALAAAMVERAVDAGVDELCHTPTEPLPPGLVERLAEARIPVVSTLHTLVAGGSGAAVLANARDLITAGVRLVYGTDLGNVATAPGPSPAELEHLADAGLGREGALVAATAGAAVLAGFAGRVDVEVATGARTVLVVLTDDPLEDPTAWDRPVAVVAGGRVVGGSAFGEAR